MSTLQTLTYRFTLQAFKNGVQRILQGWVTGENIARKLEISLQSGTEDYELPLEGITASMYVMNPSSASPSINACTIDAENNKIIYEVLPSDIQEAGIVKMQLKLFDDQHILISPLFGLEVWESEIDDSEAPESPTYTALTEALAEAQAYSEKAIAQVYVDEDYTFVIEFADGTEYTSTAIKDVIGSLVNGGEIAEGWARGTQEGVPVEEGSPYYHDNASFWSGQAHGYSGMAENAKGYAYQYANDALGYKNDASGYATTASGYVTDAHNEYLAAKSYAVGGTGTRTGEDNDCAKYYKERCEQIAASLEGGFIPMGTVLFANLPVSDIGEGWMYNVSDAFTSDSRFEDGGGIEYPAGTNVYYTALGKWDCLSSPYQTAGNTAYDNTLSGLTADDVQEAIDELASDKISKSATSGLVKNDGTIDTTTYVSDISGKADKVSGATNGNFAGLDASGNLTDSGKKASDFQTALTLTSQTATGNPISFTTDSAQVAQGTVITLEPIQSGSGDPSPSNVRTISGYDEIDLASLSNNLWTSGDQSGTNYQDISFSLPVGTYLISAYVESSDTDADVSQMVFRDSNNSAFISLSFKRNCRSIQKVTLTQDCAIIRFRASNSSSASSGDTFSFSNLIISPIANVLSDITLELDSTIYGGTLNVESGELTVTHARVDMGDISWSRASAGYFYGFISDKKSGSANFLCEIYKVIASGSDNLTIQSRSSGGQQGFTVYDSDYTTAPTFTTAVTGHYIVYELAEPIVYHLTPHQVKLLQGANVVTSNGTSISLTYRNGEVMKLDDASGLGESINAVSDLVDVHQSIIGDIAPYEDGATASKAYAVNDFFIRNNKFCKCTSAISKGSAFTLNTNYSETTISAVLTALLNA